MGQGSLTANILLLLPRSTQTQDRCRGITSYMNIKYIMYDGPVTIGTYISLGTSAARGLFSSTCAPGKLDSKHEILKLEG